LRREAEELRVAVGAQSQRLSDFGMTAIGPIENLGAGQETATEIF
jgi:hypothetical protein